MTILDILFLFLTGLRANAYRMERELGILSFYTMYFYFSKFLPLYSSNERFPAGTRPDMEQNWTSFGYDIKVPSKQMDDNFKNSRETSCW